MTVLTELEPFSQQLDGHRLEDSFRLVCRHPRNNNCNQV